MKEKVYVSPLILHSTLTDATEVENLDELREKIKTKKISISKKEIKSNSVDIYEHYRLSIEILKSDINSFLDVIESLIRNAVLNSDDKIDKVIENYKLDIDNNGLIKKKDAIKILRTVLFNIKQLDKLIEEADNINSYKKDKNKKEYICLTKSLNIN